MYGLLEPLVWRNITTCRCDVCKGILPISLIKNEIDEKGDAVKVCENCFDEWDEYQRELVSKYQEA